ncbi:MAG: hypothetical protein QOJ58_4401 [Alphaproteobacteria bacterium]|nr:hypothetical protein [Alphaproteobacteria bacterium]
MRAPDDPHPDTFHEIIKAHVADDEVRHQKPVVYPITTEPVERLARGKKTFAARRLPVDDIRLRGSDQDASVTVIGDALAAAGPVCVAPLACGGSSGLGGWNPGTTRRRHRSFWVPKRTPGCERERSLGGRLA